MSLRKKKNKSPSFFIVPGDKPGSVVMYERDKNGEVRQDEGMEFTSEDLRDPIELLTHELSERSIKRLIEKNGVNPFRAVDRYTGDSVVSMSVPHIMTALHTDSGIIYKGHNIKMSPEEFEKFLFNSLGESDLYPEQHRILLEWNRLMKEGKNTKTLAGLESVLSKLRKLRREASHNVTTERLRQMDEVIFSVERYVQQLYRQLFDSRRIVERSG